MVEPEHCIVLSTCPDAKTAELLARRLLSERRVACVNIIPGVRSIYRWQGEITEDAEVLLVIKTRTDHYPAVQASIVANHPYDVPEVLSLSVNQGLPAYLEWLDGSVRK